MKFTLYNKKKNINEVLRFYKKIQDKNYLVKGLTNLIECLLWKKEFEILFNEYKKIILDKDNTVINSFEILLEDKINKLLNEEERKRIYYIFSKGSSKYEILNKIRLNKDKLDMNLINNAITLLNCNELENYYGEIFYYLLKNNDDLNFLNKLKVADNVLEKYLIYIMQKFDDLTNQLLKLMRSLDLNHMANLRIWIIIARNLIIREHEITLDFINEYIINGVKYIKFIYNKNILEGEYTFEIKDKEHQFFVYIYKAISVKDENLSKYIEYLKKALYAYPCMKKIIEILINDVYEGLQTNETKKFDEFEECKKAFKNNINILVENNKLLGAIMLIDEYLSIVPNDIEMLSLKSELKIKLS